VRGFAIRTHSGREASRLLALSVIGRNAGGMVRVTHGMATMSCAPSNAPPPTWSYFSTIYLQAPCPGRRSIRHRSTKGAMKSSALFRLQGPLRLLVDLDLDILLQVLAVLGPVNRSRGGPAGSFESGVNSQAGVVALILTQPALAETVDGKMP